MVIGFLDALQRVARTIAIKRYFSTADVKYAVPITLTAQFIAGAVAGVALAFYRSEITTMVANIFVSTSFYSRFWLRVFCRSKVGHQASSTKFSRKISWPDLGAC